MSSDRDPGRWPDGTPRSLNNAFTRREPSGFATPQELKKVAAKMGGQKRQVQRQAAREIPPHPTMPGLSKRAQAQLSAAPQSIAIAKPADTVRRQRVRKAAV